MDAKDVQPRTSSSSSGCSSMERAKHAAERADPFTVNPQKDTELTNLKPVKDTTL